MKNLLALLLIAGLAQAAGWAQQALDFQREVAAEDLPQLAGPDGLDVAAWRALPP